MKYSTYEVYRSQLNDRGATAWFKTSHTVNARTDKEANSRMRRMFRNSGFHSMQLVAIKTGSLPPSLTVQPS